MKRSLAILLLCCLTLGLCACGSGREASNETEASVPPEIWHGRLTGSYPLGMEGQITGLAATGDALFIGGNRDGQAALLRCPYTIEEDGSVLGGETALELPPSPEPLRLSCLSYSGGRCCALFSAGSGENGEAVSWLAGLYSPEGALESSFPLALPEGAAPKSIQITGEDELCLREAHRIGFYSLTGEKLWELEDEGLDFGPPLLLDGELLLTAGTGASGEAELYRPDRENRTLVKEKTEEPVLLSYSVCQSPDGQPLINDGESLAALDSKLRSTPLLDWYELAGEYGQSFRFVCRLGERDCLLVYKEDYYNLAGRRKQDSGELVALHLYSTSPSRSVRVAFCGRGETERAALLNMFRNFIPDYEVEPAVYGTEEAEKDRLLLDVNAGKLDLVLCDGYELEPRTGFADLYPFLDADEELSREDLPAWLLEALESRGELRQLWSRFCISTWEARGALAAEPGPLRLRDCQAVLDREGVETPLFDSYVTKDLLLSYLSQTVLAAAWDEAAGTYRLDRPAVREWLELCDRQPLKDPYDAYGNQNVDPALWHSESLLYEELGVNMDIGDKRDGEPEVPARRFFDGQDGGDDLSCLVCPSLSCVLIPEACPDRENAWGFLRQLLTEDFQLALYQRGGEGLPVNCGAFEALTASVCTPQYKERLARLLEDSPVLTWETKTVAGLLEEDMQPWFNGDKSLDQALAAAQGRIDIYMAERAE